VLSSAPFLPSTGVDVNPSSAPKAPPAVIHLGELRRMRAAGERIACLTAYDASFAAVLDRAGVDVVLVGDSLGMVMQGRGSTTAVTVADIVYHSRCVAPQLQRAFLVADLPFLSYATRERALDAAQRLMQEGGAQMVKLEGGREQADIVEYLAVRGVPVCAHLGLQPQRIHQLGTFRVQGRERSAAENMLQDARALQAAGADLMVLECVPNGLARSITEAVAAPVIGIGAGADVSGQILVLQDMLGYSPLVTQGRRPRFARDFLRDGGSVEGAVRAYVEAVRDGSYPEPGETFGE
jgi:ketopantoate hydroxymethyltransferase (EC 2.1.2.11)